MAKNTINKKPIIITIVIMAVVVILAAIDINSINQRRVKQSSYLAQLYLDNKEYEKAIAEYKIILENKPDNLDARLGISKAYTAIKNYDEAEKILVEGESVLKNNFQYFQYLIDLYVSQDRVDDVYNLLTKKYEETQDDKFKELFYKYYDIAFVSEKSIVKIGDKVKIKTLMIDKNKNIKKALDIDYSVTGDNLGEIKKENDYLRLSVANNGKETIKINKGFIDEKINLLSINDINIKEISTDYSLNSEVEFQVVGVVKATVNNDNNKNKTEISSNNTSEISLESLNNKYTLNSSGNIENYNEAVPQITINNDILQLIPSAVNDSTSSFKFKAKVNKTGYTNINVVFDIYKKSLSKRIK